MADAKKAEGPNIKAAADAIISTLSLKTEDAKWAESAAKGIAEARDSYTGKNLHRSRHLSLVQARDMKHPHVGAWTEMKPAVQDLFNKAVDAAKSAL